MRPCPVPLKVLAIVGICWAGLGLLSILGSIPFQFITLSSTPPAVIAMRKEPLYIVMTATLALLSLAIDLSLLIGSIKSLKVENSGRTLLLVYAWSKLALSVVGFAWSLGFVMPRTFEATMHPPGVAMPPGMDATMKAIMYSSACFGGALTLAMPVYIFITLRLRTVRDAFQGIFVPQGSFEPVMPPPAP
ncbi:MAG: hypothetical protein ACTHN5_19630 [Phycisphaerae bacterium]